MVNSSFTFTDPISPKLASAIPKAQAFLSKTTTYHALRAETYAKLHASWTDRSGNARGGLTGLADNSKASSNHWEIILTHRVNYGIWLEVRFGGKYAIIRPTLVEEAPNYWQTATEIYNTMFNSSGA